MAKLALITGPQDAASLLAYLNSLIAAVNSGVNGMLFASTTASGTGNDTTEDTLVQFSLSPNTLNTPGEVLHIHAWGTCSADANNKTMKLYFGSEVISTGVVANNNLSWDLQLDVVRGATATSVIVVGRGLNSATPIAVYTAAGSDNTAAAIVVKCTGQNATATVNGVVCTGMTIEIAQ